MIMQLGAAEVAVVVEADIERDRKTCIALDLKVTGANRELAQWLIDHPRYSQRIVAGWLGCDHSRIFRLRKWAEGGFVGTHADKVNKPDTRTNHSAGGGGAARHQSPLESQENSEDAEVVGKNVLDTVQRAGAVADATRRILKVSPLDREAKAQISAAIDRLIAKWRSVQTLTQKGGEAS